jgi:general secretion pathway protein G
MKKAARGAGIIVAGIAVFVLFALSMFTHVGGTAQRVRHSAVTADIDSINLQLREYKAMNGSYPTIEQGLEALVIQRTSEPRPSYWPPLKELPRDPWGNNYVYRCPGTNNPDSYDLFSSGSDGIPDTADDDWGESPNGLTNR